MGRTQQTPDELVHGRARARPRRVAILTAIIVTSGVPAVHAGEETSPYGWMFSVGFGPFGVREPPKDEHAPGSTILTLGGGVYFAGGKSQLQLDLMLSTWTNFGSYSGGCILVPSGESVACPDVVKPKYLGVLLRFRQQLVPRVYGAAGAGILEESFGRTGLANVVHGAWSFGADVAVSDGVLLGVHHTKTTKGDIFGEYEELTGLGQSATVVQLTVLSLAW